MLRTCAAAMLAATILAAATAAAATTAATYFSHCKCEVKIWMLNLSAY